MVTGQEQTIAELAPRVKNVLDLHTQQIVGLRSDINTLSNKMNVKFDEVHAKIDTLKSEISKLDAKLDDSVVGLQNLIKANQTHTDLMIKANQTHMELMIKQALQELTAGPALLRTTPNAAPSVVVDDVDGQRGVDAAHDEMRTELNNSSRRIQTIYNSWLRPLRLGRPLSRVCLYPNSRNQLLTLRSKSTSDLREIS